MAGQVFSFALSFRDLLHVLRVTSCRLEVPHFLVWAADFTSSRKGIRFVESRFLAWATLDRAG
jgi:hypothetical protein